MFSRLSLDDKVYFELMDKGLYLEKINSRYSSDLCFFQVDPDGIFLERTKAPGYSWFRRNSSIMQRIEISKIKEVRKGAQTDLFCELFKGSEKQNMEALCCSLILKDGKTLNLRANSEVVRDAFLECMQFMKDRRLRLRNLWYREQFKKADKNGDEVLSIQEVVPLLKEMNIDASEFLVLFLMNKVLLNMDDFIELIRRLRSRKSLEEIFWRYSDGNETLSAENLQNLFQEEQNENVTLSKCQEIVEEFEECPDYKEKKCLTLDGFYELFNSKYFDAFDYKCSEVNQDMSRPITHYFIDSSHNTYLEGDQIMSTSRVECYVTVLEKGCRCVEIDVWDGSDGNPVVTHGYAATTKVLFSEVVAAISERAFAASEYPVILSLENHCSIEQQKKMAKIMKDAFKDAIFVGPIDADTCPTPEQLKRKIIIKAKKRDQPISTSSTESSEFVDEPLDPTEERLKDVSTAKELSDLVAICQATKFRSFKDSSENHYFRNVCSFEENKAQAMAERSPQEFISHNMRVMSRIYPHGTRLKSSNYDPIPFWLAGCQLVALNHQTPSQPMFLNRGLFSDNGGCGYVLKPEYQRDETKLKKFFDRNLQPMKKSYNIKIIDGFCLPKKPGDSVASILDPYVKIVISGARGDCKSFETGFILNNGFNPVWNEEFSLFLQHPEMALVLFEVHDRGNVSKDVVVAQRCLRVGTLALGYRMVHLKNLAGDDIASSLLVKITVES